MSSPDRRSNVRRTNVTACARCRSRKQRCDQKIPACSNCERAGSECVSTDIDGRDVPRSYIKSLEDRVAHLESQLANQNSALVDPLEQDLVEGSPLAAVQVPARDAIDQVALHTQSIDAFHRDILMLDGGLFLQTLLHEPLRTVSDSQKTSDHRSLLRNLPLDAQLELPTREGALQLTEAYFEHTEFFSPIIASKDEFLASLESLYAQTDTGSSSGSPPTLAKFRVSVVFATAVLLVNRTDSSFPVTRAEGYFATALSVLTQKPTAVYTGDLDHLCNILLIAQYTSFASNLTGAWNFLGLASRLAVELGLHDERFVVAKLDKNARNYRRWLFWALYSLERNLCMVMGRPFSISDEAIHTSLPGVEPDDRPRSLAVHQLAARQLQSEIYTTLTQKQPVNGAVIDLFIWRETVRQKLLAWVASSPEPAGSSSQLAPTGIIVEGTLHNSLVMLYYPCSYFPSPSEGDVLILAYSATEAIKLYRRAFRDGQLRFFWRTVHHLFRSGMAMVYCIHVMQARYGYADLTRADMLASVNTCNSILWAMVERYPAGRIYRDAFEKVAEFVLNGADGMSMQVLDRLSHGEPFAMPPNMLENFDLPPTAADVLYWGFGGVT